MSNVQNQILRSAVAIPSHVLESVKPVKRVQQGQPLEANFDTFYDENIKEQVAEYAVTKKAWKISANAVFWALLAFVIIAGFGFGAMGPDRIDNIFEAFDPHSIFTELVSPLAGLILFILFKYKRILFGGRNNRSRRSKRLGDIIIPQIFRFMNNGCTFFRTPSIDAVDLNLLDIDPSRHRYFCHDEVVGERNGIAFKMMELEIEEEVKSSKSNSSHYVSVFNGVYLLVDVPKPFTGRIDIKRDVEKFARTFTSVFSTMKHVRLEDPEFEKAFQVYSDNQVEARYLLTTTMMQSLNDLRFALGGKSLEGSFYNGKLALRIDSPHDLFEIKAGLDEEGYRDEAKKIIDDLNSIFKTIDAMDLNTQRIV